MSQFGGAKNIPPWGRPNPGAPGQQLNPQLFTGMGQMGLGAQQLPLQHAAAMHNAAINAAQLGMAGLGQMPGLPVNAAAFTSQAPPPGGLAAMGNAAAVSTMANLGRNAVNAQQQNAVANQKNQRAFVGVVTKMQDNYGFVDDDVFFQTTVVRGAMPRVGERVMVEANYNPNMPFKWNAFRIQLLQHQEQPTPVQAPPQQQPSQAPNPRPREERWGPAQTESVQARSSIDFARQLRDRSPIPRRRDRTPPPPPRERRPTPPRRSPPPPRRRSPSPRRDRHSSVVSTSSNLKRERSRSPTRERESPPRRRARLNQPARYANAVMLPKTALDTQEMTAYWLRKTMTSMYIPSDFFLANSHWHTAFPLHRPFNLGHPCTFHVMSKEIEALGDKVAVLDPPDADYRYSAKVMLMANPALPELYKKTLGLGDDEIINDTGCVTPQRAINFLVGLRGKSEIVSIGGPWSPSLDGPDPDTDPRTLINTATRTCLALTGVDLSGCTQWYKFVELKYRRVEKEKDGDQPAAASGRVESVTVFLPDVWTTAPDQARFEALQTALKAQLQAKLDLVDAPPPPPTPDAAAVTAETPTSAAVTAKQDEPMEIPDTPTTPSVNEEVKGEPTHWNQLDLKSMKVTELRAELVARGLDSKGVKAALSTRLMKALKEEEEKEASDKEKEETKPVEGETKEGEEQKPEEEKTETADEKKEEIAPAEGAEKMDDDIVQVAEIKKAEKTKEEIEAEEKEKQKQKEKEDKEKKEKKAAIEKHYVIPTTPGVLVFPNKTAKGGKFECKTMSLHQLLDYRQEDNKEHSFEVAVFAEAFYEMICRDAAFDVYKTLLAAPDKDYEERKKKEEEEKKKAEEAKKKAEDEAALKKLEEEAQQIAEAAKKDALAKEAEQNGEKEGEVESMDTTDSPEIVKEITPAKEDKKEDKAKESPKKDKDRPRSKSKEREEQKKWQAVVRCPERLWSFTVFDQGRDGKIPDKDAEEILLSLGLKLSRAQVQRIVRRVSVRDNIGYKQYIETMIHKDTKEVKKEPLLFPIADDEQLALGNNVPASSPEPAKRGGRKSHSSETPTVLYQGTVVDVAQIMAHLKSMEQQQNAMVMKNATLEKDLKTSKERNSILDKKKTRLDDDLSKYKKRLNDAEKCLKTSQDDTVQLKTALQESKKLSERITRAVDKVMPDKKAKKDEKKEDEKKEKKDELTTPTSKLEEITSQDSTPAKDKHDEKNESGSDGTFKEPEPVVEAEKSSAGESENSNASQNNE